MALVQALRFMGSWLDLATLGLTLVSALAI